MKVPPEPEHWLDEAAGRLVRPYTVSNGRTRPSTHMELLSTVVATGLHPRDQLGSDHTAALGFCKRTTTVAEVAARLRLPAVVTKIVLSDLVDSGALIMRAPGPAAEPSDTVILENILDALQRRL